MAHGVEHRFVGGRADHITDAPRVRAISAPSSANRTGFPFLDAPARRRLDADHGCPSVAVPTSSAALRRAPSGCLVGQGHACATDVSNAYATSAFAFSAMCARESGATASDQRSAAPPERNPTRRGMPDQASSRLLRISGSKLIARS